MKVLRSTFVAAVAIFAAACGDKVTVAGPVETSTTAKVNSVTVAPSTATMAIGQTVSFSAVVDVSNAAATTVTWASSDASKVAVSATGVATAVAATPGVAVCATSTADANKKGCSSVVVSAAAAAPTIVPASVSIYSITGNVGGLNAPVNPSAVTGVIDVRANVAAGTETVSKIVVLVGTTRADSQTFTAAQASAIRAASDLAVAEQSAFPPVLFSINTAKFNATTGVPAWLNGAYNISVQLYTTASGAAARSTATESTPLSFTNLDGFVITTSGGNTAVDAAGYRWNGGGSLTVNALPVIYSGATLGTVTAALSANTATGTTCAAAVGAAGSATTKTGNVYVTTATLAGLASAAGCRTTFPNMVTITATNSTGDVLTLAGTATTPAGVIGTQSGLRWDNIAPPTAGMTAALAVNGRTGNWINDAVNFGQVVSGTNVNGAIAAAVVDAEFGGTITYTVRVAATYAAAKTAAGLSNATTLNAGVAGSATNADWCGIVFTTDALGNTQSGGPGGTCGGSLASGAYALPLVGVASVPFGVDRAAPTIAYSGGLAANAQIATATVAAPFTVTVNDTGLVGNSGMAPGAPVKMQISQRIAAGNGVGTTTCINADVSAATCGTLTNTGVAAAAPLYSTGAAFTAATTDAYFTYSATAFDAAGNSASVASRTVVHDDGTLTVSSVSSPITVSAVGFSASSFVNDALDIAGYWFSGDYTTINGVSSFVTGASDQPVRFASSASTVVNAYNAASLINTNYAVSTNVSLPLALQFAGVLYPLATLEANATNQGGLLVTGATGVAPAVSPALVVFAPTGLATFPAITGPATIVSGVTTTPATSGTLTVVSTGPTATYNNPFSRVEFWAANNGGAAGTEMRLIGSATTPTLADNGATRTFSWTAAISGATLYTQLGYSATAVTKVIAVGYNAAGTIGYVNAAAYSLTITK